MIKIISKDKCCGCYACYNACPKACIKVEQDNEGFWYPVVDEAKCINCGLCEKVCPVINPATSEFVPIAYAAINKDEKVRYESSSGGVLTLLAEYALNKGGSVFGAIFNKDFAVTHQEITTIDELKLLRGSKYVQSRISDTYKKVEERLVNGGLVLFTGTPCQVNGLKTFLGKEYESLICMDIICHGVPSPLVWKKYVAYRIFKDGEILKRITFRFKDTGWKLYSILFEYANKIEYRSKYNKDLYMQGFLQNLYLRPSCYNCSFKTEQRASDFTLADFWGIEKLLPEMDDNKGTSLVVVQSKKGATIFNAIINKMIYKSVCLDDAIHFNSSMITSATVNKKRRLFFEEIDEYDNIEDLLNKYTRVTLLKKTLVFIKIRMRQVLRKLKSEM